MAGPYNGFMTTIHDHSAASGVPQFARAGSFLEGLAAQDSAQLGGALAPGLAVVCVGAPFRTSIAAGRSAGRLSGLGRYWRCMRVFLSFRRVCRLAQPEPFLAVG